MASALTQVTFPLAFLGYVGLAACAVLARRGTIPRSLLAATAAIVLAHVLLVWTVRYQWVFATAVRNGYAGFIVFHTALAAILAALAAGDARARLLLIGAFVVVTLGAVGAVLTYPEISYLRVPVILTAMAGAVGLATPRRWLSGRKK